MTSSRLTKTTITNITKKQAQPFFWNQKERSTYLNSRCWIWFCIPLPRWYHSLANLIGLQRNYNERLQIAIGINFDRLEELLPINVQLFKEQIIAEDTYSNDTRTERQKASAREDRFKTAMCKYLGWDLAVKCWACDFLLVLSRIPEAVFQARKKEKEKQLYREGPRLDPKYQSMYPELMETNFYRRSGMFRDDIVSPFETPGEPRHAHMYITPEESEIWFADPANKAMYILYINRASDIWFADPANKK